MARRFQASDVVEKAIDYHLLAGQEAVKIAANQEAIDHYQAGLALLSALPDTPARARRELALQIAAGRADRFTPLPRRPLPRHRRNHRSA
jgi:predicted ATPase